jgi:hypothetical protein
MNSRIYVIQPVTRVSPAVAISPSLQKNFLELKEGDTLLN